MTQTFKNIKEANKYNAFDKNLLDIAYCLPLESMINFTALSTHFNKVINDRKSVFLKKWAIKTNGMKYFKSKTFDFNHCKLKLVTERVCDTKKKMAKFPTPPWWKPLLCRKCDKYNIPMFHRCYYEDRNNEYCNCEIMDCISKREQIEQEIHDREKKLIRKRQNLINDLCLVDENIKKLKQQKKELKAIPSYKSMVPLIKNLKENGHYKNTRKQAEKLLSKVMKLVLENANERVNANFNDVQASANAIVEDNLFDSYSDDDNSDDDFN